MDLDIKESGQFCTLKPKGRLICGEPVNQFEAAFQRALSSGHIYFIIDLEAVPSLDSSGIGALLNILRASSKVGGNAKLVKPASLVGKTLNMVGVLQLFSVFETEEEAMAASAAS